MPCLRPLGATKWGRLKIFSTAPTSFLWETLFCKKEELQSIHKRLLLLFLNCSRMFIICKSSSSGSRTLPFQDREKTFEESQFPERCWLLVLVVIYDTSEVGLEGRQFHLKDTLAQCSGGAQWREKRGRCRSRAGNRQPVGQAPVSLEISFNFFVVLVQGGIS